MLLIDDSPDQYIRERGVGGQFTVYTLKFAARRYIHVVAVWTKQFDGVETWHVAAAAWHDVATHTINAGARPEHPVFIFFNLKVDE